MFNLFFACKVDDTCGYFVWLDPPACARGRELVPWRREKIDSLEKEVAAAHAKEKNYSRAIRLFTFAFTGLTWSSYCELWDDICIL